MDDNVHQKPILILKNISCSRCFSFLSFFLLCWIRIHLFYPQQSASYYIIIIIFYRICYYYYLKENLSSFVRLHLHGWATSSFCIAVGKIAPPSMKQYLSIYLKIYCTFLFDMDPQSTPMPTPTSIGNNKTQNMCIEWWMMRAKSEP